MGKPTGEPIDGSAGGPTGAQILKFQTVQDIAADPDAPGELGAMARKALREAAQREAAGERVIYVFSGDQLFCLNAVFRSTL